MATKTKLDHIPAPWNDMKGEAYLFASVSNASNVPPSSAYDPLERNSSFADPEISGHFAGGLGMLMIMRYHDAPCGPYDELLLMPGSYDVPVRGDGAQRMRITRIYVSSAASTFYGRRTWNIPKRVAEFTFTPRTDGYAGYKRVEVRLPGAEKPFFAINLTPSWLSLVKVPVNTWYLPVKGLVQPPLPTGEEPERVGTDTWCGLTLSMRGTCSAVWASGGLETGEWSDGVGMSPLSQMYAMGVLWENFRLDVSEATEPTE